MSINKTFVLYAKKKYYIIEPNKMKKLRQKWILTLSEIALIIYYYKFIFINNKNSPYFFANWLFCHIRLINLKLKINFKYPINILERLI
jgi:hypothetical protein